MARSVRLYTPAQSEEVRTLVDLLAELIPCLPPADRDRLTAFLRGPGADGARRPPPRRRTARVAVASS